ncbi:peptide chain release factor 1 [Aminithiophilus ramosus]|uniref:Peptide chain release factor 1 n=2 Tax=Synergistales TaxID=649776 RepID=A0A9Q7A4S6_9BACT|nr:peptide chain release factor 1 [Aminithiophilus ramosus]QTX31306.1 peptide chain release factor 1 [Aminithiophilus ramosus]QVL35107.1 peptide chain release factor 1 [Synergistota bacterium]
MDLMKKLEEIEKNYMELEDRMGLPQVAGNPAELQKLAKRHSDLTDLVAVYREYRQASEELGQARELLNGGDADMTGLAREEIHRLQPLMEAMERRLSLLLLPRDPNDEKSVIIEIRGGAGGEEAALFAHDLFRMYSRFAERKGWKVEVLSTSETGIGGLKEIAARLDGHGAYSLLKFESGVHRVQRVPVTESGGRIHTSTATVAVLPEAEEVDVEVRTEDLKIDTYRASGAGGQYVNMTDSAVRITHLPTGVVVTCQDERSQLKNRVKALNLLRTRLYDRELQRKNAEMAAERKGQVGTGDRSERIRTYNFSQNRVTDHRINVTLHKLDAILDGDLFELIDALVTADEAERLKNLEG